ncbi:MAG: hypothetical protein ACI8VL_002160, partial [Bacteroidia bacterium]
MQEAQIKIPVVGYRLTFPLFQFLVSGYRFLASGFFTSTTLKDYAADQMPFGSSTEPYSADQTSLGSSSEPYSADQTPFGSSSEPYSVE